MKKTLFFTVICFLLTVQSIAQRYGNFEKVPFAVGILPPLSTNGKHAGNCVNQASINLLAGYSAGLSGVEISAFSNSERDFAHGIQIAGFGNFVGGEFAGFQFSSFANFNKGISNGSNLPVSPITIIIKPMEYWLPVFSISHGENPLPFNWRDSVIIAKMLKAFRLLVFRM